MRRLSIPELELKAAVKAVRLEKKIIKEHKKDALLQFCSESTTVYISNRKQQVIRAYQVPEILFTTDVSLWKRMSGINNPSEIGTRGVV